MAVGFVLISCEAGRDHEVFDALREIPEIVEPMALFGEYDLIAKIESADFDELGRIVLQKVRAIPGVTSTKTLTGTRF